MGFFLISMVSSYQTYIEMLNYRDVIKENTPEHWEASSFLGSDLIMVTIYNGLVLDYDKTNM